MNNETLTLAGGITEWGFLAVAAGAYLTLSTALMAACFRWLRRLVDNVMQRSEERLDRLLETAGRQSDLLAEVAEALRPLSLSQARTVGSAVLRAEALNTGQAVAQWARAEHDDATLPKRWAQTAAERCLRSVRTLLNSFCYRGRRLSAYTDDDWADVVAEAAAREARAPEGSATGGIARAFEGLIADFYRRLDA